MQPMTLDKPQRDVVREVIGKETVPDAVVIAVEGDELLAHLCDAMQSLTYAEKCQGAGGDAGPLARQVREQAQHRVNELIEIHEVAQ